MAGKSVHLHEDCQAGVRRSEPVATRLQRVKGAFLTGDHPFRTGHGGVPDG